MDREEILENFIENSLSDLAEDLKPFFLQYRNGDTAEDIIQVFVSARVSYLCHMIKHASIDELKMELQKLLNKIGYGNESLL